MNIQVSAKAFTSGDEQREAARRIRRKLMGTPKGSVNLFYQSQLVQKITELTREVYKLRMEIDEAEEAAAAQREVAAVREDLIESLGAFEEETPERLTAKQVIIRELERFPKFTYAMIVGASRTAELVEARHQCMYAVHKARPDMSLPHIGRIFKRDHTSILHAIRKMEGRKASLNGKEG